MGNLIGRDKWIVFAAVASLVVAAVYDELLQVSEITTPRILAEAVFSAQRGKPMAFHESSSGFPSGCFSIANIVLVKRLRETLYSALLYQDIYFFDTEAVGGLTSRLSADCQRLSNVIGNDINMIVRNSLQVGAGAFINMMTLSWPLTLSAVLICSFLYIIVSVYGQRELLC